MLGILARPCDVIVLFSKASMCCTSSPRVFTCTPAETGSKQGMAALLSQRQHPVPTLCCFADASTKRDDVTVTAALRGCGPGPRWAAAVLTLSTTAGSTPLYMHMGRTSGRCLYRLRRAAAGMQYQPEPLSGKIRLRARVTSHSRHITCSWARWLGPGRRARRAAHPRRRRRRRCTGRWCPSPAA